MAVFDALRHLSNYLYDAHTQGKHHLADLYELVQYAGNIVPRLYLMITVGSVYMSINDAPVKEVMKDMMEMSRGVLHPIRGLFLRHYLSGQTRDHLPVGIEAGYVNAGYFFIRIEPCQAFRKFTGFHLICPYELYRDEQVVGTAATPGALKRPGEARDGTQRTSHPRRHKSCPTQSAGRSGLRPLPKNYPPGDSRTGRQLQGCDRTGISDGSCHPGALDGEK